MLFNTSEFAVFFLVVLGLYWGLRRHYRWQNILLLAGSLLFYGWWDVRFLFLFILTTTVDFYCALMIQKGRVSFRERMVETATLLASAFFCVTVQWQAPSISLGGPSLAPAIDWAAILPRTVGGWGVFAATAMTVLAVNLADSWLTSFTELRRRKVFLAASVISNLSVLGFFKYYNFFADSFAQLVHSLLGVAPSTWTLNLILPVGISFYTFQSLAYTIDVYRRKVEPVERYLSLATCLSFFPLLVAGPIERPNRFFPQFFRPRSVNCDQFGHGLWLISWGLFKKMVVADNMALVVASVFGPYDGASPSASVPHDGLRLLVGVYAFAFQIYGDFSGYSDIARGTARLLGFDIMLNFNLPYLAVSPSDFWQRWHISLSSWLRDYLYIPLGGNRGGTLQTYRNLFLTMLLGGLWHGANWTFVIWGAFHGLILIIYRMVAPNLGTVTRMEPAGALVAAPKAGEREQAAVAVYSTLIPMGVPATLALRFKSGAKYAVCLAVMFHLTCIGWLLFRARNLTTVSVFLKGIVLSPHSSPETVSLLNNVVFYGWFLVLFQLVQYWMGSLDAMRRLPWFVRLNVWIFVLMSLFALSSTAERAFIYFAF